MGRGSCHVRLLGGVGAHAATAGAASAQPQQRKQRFRSQTRGALIAAGSKVAEGKQNYLKCLVGTMHRDYPNVFRCTLPYAGISIRCPISSTRLFRQQWAACVLSSAVALPHLQQLVVTLVAVVDVHLLPRVVLPIRNNAVRVAQPIIPAQRTQPGNRKQTQE
eukprot:365535-Chlamydomonas_euryale.AAC.22